MSAIDELFDSYVPGDDDPDGDPGTVRCKFCGSTRVYWMTVLGRREAQFLAKNGTPRALALAKARLFNLDGGEHNCRSIADPDEFDAV